MPRHKLERPNYQLRRRGKVWVIDWTDRVTGRSRSISTGEGEHQRAEIWRDQWIAGREQPAPPPLPLVKDILDGYVAARLPKVESTETLQLSAKVVARHIGSLAPPMLGRSTYLERRNRDGVADGTIRREVVTLRAALNWAVQENWITAAPYVEMPPKPPPRDRWLLRDEVEWLIACCVSAHMRMFSVLAYHTAARTAAILDLTWDRADLDAKCIHYALPGRRITKKRRATVPINAVALAELQAARAVAVSDYVIEYHGRPVKSVKKAFARACTKAGIADCSPHVLRHTAATHMVLAGVPLTEVARMLGDTVAMIEKVYGHHTPEFLRTAANALAGDRRLKLVPGVG